MGSALTAPAARHITLIRGCMEDSGHLMLRIADCAIRLATQLMLVAMGESETSKGSERKP